MGKRWNIQQADMFGDLYFNDTKMASLMFAIADILAFTNRALQSATKQLAF